MQLRPTATPVSTYITPAIRQPEQAQRGPGPQAPNAGPSGAAQVSDAARRLAAITGSLIQPVLQEEVRQAKVEGAAEGASLDPFAAKENARAEALKLKSINPLLSPVQYARQSARIETMADNAVERLKDEAIAALPRLSDPDNNEDLDSFLYERISEFGFTGIAQRQATLKAESIRRELQPQIIRAKAARIEQSKNQALVNRGSLIAANIFDTAADTEVLVADLKDASNRHYEEYGVNGRRYLLQGLTATLQERVTLARRADDADEIQRLIGELEPLIDSGVFNADEALELENQLARAESIGASIIEDPTKLAEKLREEQTVLLNHYYNTLAENPEIDEGSLKAALVEYGEQQNLSSGAAFRFNEEIVKRRFEEQSESSTAQQEEDATDAAYGIVAAVQRGEMPQDEAMLAVAAIPHLQNTVAVDVNTRLENANRQRARSAQLVRTQGRPIFDALRVFETPASFAFVENENDSFAYMARLNSALTKYMENEWQSSGLPEEEFASWAADRQTEILETVKTDPQTGLIDLEEGSPVYDALLPFVQELNAKVNKTQTAANALATAGSGVVHKSVGKAARAVEQGLKTAAESSDGFDEKILQRAAEIYNDADTNRFSVQPDGVYVRKVAPRAFANIAAAGGRTSLGISPVRYTDELGQIDRQATADLLAYVALTGNTRGLSQDLIEPINNPRSMGVFNHPRAYETAVTDWLRPNRTEEDFETEVAVRFFDFAKAKFPAEAFPYQRTEEGVQQFLSDQMNIYAPLGGVYFKELDQK